ncbi:hypothetical protein F4774DRAFT_398185 [Daldinia eschscholtzii]|nr:hypothetical protein F4774DRAFT_398185 [Daldinia eschscholtzii]
MQRRNRHYPFDLCLGAQLADSGNLIKTIIFSHKNFKASPVFPQQQQQLSQTAHSKVNMEPGMPLPPWEQFANWYDIKLEDILPRDGFVFPEGYKIFKVKEDWARVKWAIEAPVPTLEKEKVDSVLAAIMEDANTIVSNFRRIHSSSIRPGCLSTNAILESARKMHDWTKIVPDGRFPRLLKKLIHARTLYNQITRILGRSEAEKGKEQGKLAAAIDVWTKTRPVDNPKPFYARMPEDLKQYMIKRMIEGKGAKWGSDDEHTDEKVISSSKPNDCGTDKKRMHKKRTDRKIRKALEKKPRKASKKTSKKKLTDEDAPWVHTNYSSSPARLPGTPASAEQEDDENAPWIPWSQTMRARQLLRTPTTERLSTLRRT